MEQNADIQQLVQLLQVLILAGGGARIVYCLTMRQFVEDASSYSTRMKHTFVFIVLAELITGVLNLVVSYF